MIAEYQTNLDNKLEHYFKKRIEWSLIEPHCTTMSYSVNWFLVLGFLSGSSISVTTEGSGLIVSLVSDNHGQRETTILALNGGPGSEVSNRTTNVNVLQLRDISRLAFNFRRHRLYLLDLSTKAVIPEAIAVDPLAGYLFWSDTGGRPKIERAGLDGSGRKVLVLTGLILPSSITIGHGTRQIYWVDTDKHTVEAIGYDGNNRRVIAKRYKLWFTSVTLNKDWLYALDAKTNAIIVINRESGATNKTNLSFDKPTDLLMYSEASQPTAQDFCADTTCDHLCFGSTSGAKCACFDGYHLANDTVSCTLSTSLPAHSIFLSNMTHFCIAYIRYFLSNEKPESSVCSAMNTLDIKHIAADLHRSEIYYYSSQNETLNRLSLNRQLPETLLYGVGNVGGIAVDWIKQRLYFTQPDEGAIHYCSLEPADQKHSVRVLSALGTPLSIALDLVHGNIFWNSLSEDGEIEMATMEGQNRQVVSQEKRVVRLQFDTVSNRLYWFNGENVKSFGNGELRVEQHTMSRDIDLFAVYRNFTVWTEVTGNQKTDSLYFSKHDEKGGLEKKPNMINASYFGDMGRLTGLLILDPDSQPIESGPCDNNNGNCEQICISEDSTHSCKCKMGMTLNEDRQTCSSEKIDENFLLVTDLTFSAIYKVSRDTDDLVVVDLPYIDSPVSPLYVHETHDMIWVENSRQEIVKANLLTGIVTVIHRTGDFVLQHLTMDYSTRNLYYVTQQSFAQQIHSYIQVLTFDGSVRKTLVHELEEANNIAIYPSNGFMFWTSTGNSPHIGRSSMDGSNVMRIVDTDLVYPHGLGLDHISRRVYWCDEYTDTIESVNFHGHNRQFLYRDAGARMWHIALSGHYLYFTAANRRTAMSINLRNPKEIKPVITDPNAGIISSIFVSSGNATEATNLCSVNNGNCSSICLPTPNGRICSCRDDIAIMDDQMTCSDVIRCPNDIKPAYLLTCSRRPQKSCQYDCEANKIPTSVPASITCTEEGTWNLPPGDLCEDNFQPPDRDLVGLSVFEKASIASGCILLVVISLVVLVHQFGCRSKSSRCKLFVTKPQTRKIPEIKVLRPSEDVYTIDISFVDKGVMSSNEFASAKPPSGHHCTNAGAEEPTPTKDSKSEGHGRRSRTLSYPKVEQQETLEKSRAGRIERTRSESYKQEAENREKTGKNSPTGHILDYDFSDDHNTDIYLEPVKRRRCCSLSQVPKNTTNTNTLARDVLINRTIRRQSALSSSADHDFEMANLDSYRGRSASDSEFENSEEKDDDDSEQYYAEIDDCIEEAIDTINGARNDGHTRGNMGISTPRGTYTERAPPVMGVPPIPPFHPNSQSVAVSPKSNPRLEQDTYVRNVNTSHYWTKGTQHATRHLPLSASSHPQYGTGLYSTTDYARRFLLSQSPHGDQSFTRHFLEPRKPHIGPKPNPPRISSPSSDTVEYRMSTHVSHSYSVNNHGVSENDKPRGVSTQYSHGPRENNSGQSRQPQTPTECSNTYQKDGHDRPTEPEKSLCVPMEYSDAFTSDRPHNSCRTQSGRQTEHSHPHRLSRGGSAADSRESSYFDDPSKPIQLNEHSVGRKSTMCISLKTKLKQGL
ncbi:hypothetical protein ScPMuIL_010568 [Solemya velum]